MRITPAFFIALLISGTSLAYAADLGFQKTLTANGHTALTVCGNSGIVHVTGVDGDKILISAKIHKSNWHAIGNGDEMKQVVDHPPIQQSGKSVKVGDSATCGEKALPNVDVDYDISVPKDSTVKVTSGSGSIQLDSVKGFAVAKIGAGDIVANAIGSDTLLETGSGSITATGLKSGLRADTGKGDLTISGTPEANWQMRTGNGNIHFQSDPTAKFSLDAEAGSGTVDSTLPSPLSGHIANGVLRGPVRGGGPAVKMYTVAGNIDVH